MFSLDNATLFIHANYTILELKQDDVMGRTVSKTAKIAMWQERKP